MKKTHQPKHSLEILESRIAPATIPLGAQWLQATHSAEGTPILLKAGQGLSTGGLNSGDYLLYIEKGNAWVFTTDFNNNNLVDFNEITGIAAGDGLRMISFVDIHGDIATNLKETQTSAGLIFSLSDSNNNPADDNPTLRGDGRAILNNRIEKIELRTLTVADIPDQDGNGVVNQLDVDLRRVPSTHSIFGNIYAGRGFGVSGDPTSGLLIDRTVITNFGFEDTTQPSIGSIRVGTAVSGEYFSFGVKGGFESSGGVMEKRIRAGIVIGDDTQGYIAPFVPSPGQPGATIAFVRSAQAGQNFNLNGLYAGDGGSGASGGNVEDVTVSGDDAGGYAVVAGNGGSGTRGGVGGSILRFSDLNSDTSQVVIRGGSGGNGSTGAGGNAGVAEIVNSNFYGNYTVVLGNGGDGFTQGGNGASLARAEVTQPTPAGIVSGTAAGTSHSPAYYNPDPSLQQNYVANIGTSQGIDIDGDGFGDYVYSTLTTSQVVVMFGTGTPGLFRSTISPEGLVQSDRIYLPSPRNAEALAVGDLNGDGRPDVVAGSSDASNQAGVSVFVAKWEDINKDGDVIDPVDEFLGFYDVRYSTLPQLERGDPETIGLLPYWESPQQIGEIVIGDFDGDGANELAVAMLQYQEREQNNDITIRLTRAQPVLLFLSPDRELDTNSGKYFLTGQFFADFGTKRVTTPTETAPPVPRLPFIATTDLGNNGSFEGIIIEATALSEAADHDVVIVGIQGNEDTFVLSTVDYFNRAGGASPVSSGSWSLGGVDTNRNVAQGNNPNTNFTRIGLHDFAVVDFDADNRADLVVLSQSPGNYMVGVNGNGAGSGVQDSTSPSTQDQAGFFFGNNTDARGIKAADQNLDGIVDGFLVLFDNPNSFSVGLYDYASGPSRPGLSGPTPVATLLTVADHHVGQYRTGITDAVLWDVTFGNLEGIPTWGVGVSPEAGRLDDNILFSSGGAQREAQPGLRVFAGDGGDSFIGKGGTGGFIGGKGKLETIVDPNNGTSTTDFTGAIQITFDGAILLQAGDGGLGFSRGGNGGSITGVSVRDSDAIPLPSIPAASLIAGDGGRGISGPGGFGGDLIGNSIYNGRLFAAGDGGDGRVGGRGGAVIGNGLNVGTSRVFDTLTAQVVVLAGHGGDGLRGGGAGGSILNFLPIVEGLPGGGGYLRYTAGSGGNAVQGVGGKGGSVLNSSPELNATLEGQILIESGHGGDGTVGGAGGDIRTFSVTQGATANVAVLGVVAGHGGNGTTGAGGRGGSVSAINVKSVGSGFDLLFASFASPDDVTGTFFTYSRVMSGNGGTSFGGRGGDAGSVSNVVTGATNGVIAVVGGAGGAGLHQGGLGGSIINVALTGLGAGTTSKGIVIAGAGGDARAYIPNPNDQTPDQGSKAFGGRVGKGGNGGNINGFTQQGDPGAHIDLIAGNGGSTVNYGTSIDKKTFVGRGGSILNVNLSGNAGNVLAETPISSYNKILTGETMQDFVERRMRDGEVAFETLGDADGNVGVVVGSAGRNKAVALDPLGAPFEFSSQPATNAKNGDLINFRADTLMSAVAGSVDRIAKIQLARNITVSATLVGTDKGVVGVNEFLNSDGAPVDANGDPLIGPVLDGRLIDGIFYAKALVQPVGVPALQGNIFVGGA